jgi:hypothetical protein
MKVGKKRGGWLFKKKTKFLLLLKGTSIFESSRHFAFQNVHPSKKKIMVINVPSNYILNKSYEVFTRYRISQACIFYM